MPTPNPPGGVPRVFRRRDFRILGLGTVLGALAVAGESVIVSWFVLELTDSPLQVGVTLGLHMVPNALFGIPAGIVADLVNRPRFIAAVNAAMVVPITVMGLLIMNGSAQMWHVLLLTFVFSTLLVFDRTARGSFVYDVVGRSNAVQGLAVMSLTGRAGAVVGSVAAGLLILPIGPGPALFAVAAVFVLTAAAMMGVRSRGQAAPIVRVSARTAFAEFVKELRTNRVLLTLTITTAALEILGFSHRALLPSLARDVLGVGPEGLGLMNGIGSLGGGLGVVFLSARGDTGRKGILYVGTILVFGLGLLLLGLAANFILALLVLALLSSVMALADTLSQGLMQLAVPNELRGRAMGSWLLALGAGPIGTIQIGALAAQWSVLLALSVNGLGLVALAAAIALLVPSVRRL